MLCVPSVNGVVGVNDHLPSEPTVVLPKTVLPSYTVIVVPAVPVPLIKGDASFVELPLLTLPVIGCLSSKTVAGVVGVAGGLTTGGLLLSLSLSRLCAHHKIPPAVTGTAAHAHGLVSL